MKLIRKIVQRTLLLSFLAACTTTVFSQTQPRAMKPVANMLAAVGRAEPARAEIVVTSVSWPETSPGDPQAQDNDPMKKIKKGDSGKDDSGAHHESEQEESKPIVINFDFYFFHMAPPKNLPAPKGLPKGVPTPAEIAAKAAAPFRGTASLTINPDGSYDFAGTCPALHTDDSYTEFALALGIKSSEGSVILFPMSGSLRYGKFWNKQGSNRTIKDNWKAFVKGHDWHWVLKYQDVVEPSQPSASASSQDSNGGGVDAGSVIHDVVDALGVVGAILAIF